MFQRRMILVASRLRNTQLSPKFTRTTKAAHQNVNDDINEEGDYEETSTHRRSVDEQLQSICNVNSRRSIHEAADLQQQSKNIPTSCNQHTESSAKHSKDMPTTSQKHANSMPKHSKDMPTTSRNHYKNIR